MMKMRSICTLFVSLIISFSGNVFALDCSNATPLTCGASYWAYPPSASHFNETNYSTTGCASPSADYTGYDHLYRLNVGTEQRSLTINISNLSSDMDILVFKSCGKIAGSTSFANCVASSTNTGAASESINIPYAVGEYYIVIDGKELWDRSGYEISVFCGTSPDPHGCSTAKTLTCGETIYQPSGGNNSFNSSHYDISDCTHASYEYEGYDNVYKIQIGSPARNIKLKMTGLSADMDMFLFQTCNSYGETSFSDCAGFSINYGNDDEEINLYNAIGTYYLVVDGFTHGTTSSYNLSLSCIEDQPIGCEGAKAIYCGTSDWVNAPTKNNLSNSNYDLSGCYGNPYNNYDGKDHIYEVHTGNGHNQSLKIDVSGFSHDMNIYLFKSCSGYNGVTRLSQCAGSSARSGLSSESIIVENAKGTYYLVVESDDAWYSSGYEIDVTCETQHNPICHYATPIHCNGNYWFPAATTNSLDINNYGDNSCLPYGATYTGNDYLFVIHPEENTHELVIDMSHLGEDLDMMLFQKCTSYGGQDRLEHCVSKSANSGLSDEQIVVSNPSGPYYLVVDADDPWYGSGFELKVHCKKYTVPVCHYAAPLHCGDSKWIQPSSTNHLDHDNYNLAGCFGYQYEYKGNDHLYEIDTRGYTGSVVIEMTNLSADLDLLLFSSCSSHQGIQKLENCIDYSIKGGAADERIIIEYPGEVYYLVVDAADPWDVSGYEISVSCYEAPSYTCDDALWLSCNDSKWMDASNVNHLSGEDYIFGNCGVSDPYNGNDHVFELSVGSHPQNVTIEISQLSKDLDLLVFSSCSPNYDKARLGNCLGTSTQPGAASEMVHLEDVSGTIYIAVDTRDPWAKSSYKIKVTCEDEHEEEEEEEEEDPLEEEEEDPIEVETELSCGVTIYGTTIEGESNFNGDDLNECFPTNLVFTGADVLIPFSKENEGQKIELTMIQESANLSLFVLNKDLAFVEDYCKGSNFSRDKIIENSSVIGEVFNDEGVLPVGEYYALIEGYNRTIESDFSLTMNCSGDCVVADSLVCETAIDSIDFSLSEGGTTSSYILGDDLYVGYTGNEWIADLNIESSSTITIGMYPNNSEGDLDLFLRDSCGADVVLAASTNFDNASESIEITLDAGHYEVVVDGWLTNDGSFDIEVTGCADTTNAIVLAETRSGLLNKGVVTNVQVVPNPFKESTVFWVEANQESEASLSIISVTGQVLLQRQVSIVKGKQAIEISSGDLKDYTGLLIYQLSGPEIAAEGRIVRVR